MNPFKISVITPSFNSGKFIERAVESVREQQYDNIEHIIVDGGSTDSTIDFLKSNKDLKWISEPDKGQSHAMNKGFNMSTGDIIVYLNADDYFFPGVFKTVINYFNKGYKFVMGNVLVKHEMSEIINKPRYSFKEMLNHWEKNAFCFNPVGYFYRREVQIKVPFNLNNHYSMDLEFLIEVSLNFKIKKTDTTFGVFDFSQDGKTKNTLCNIEYWKPENWLFIESSAKKYLNKKEFNNFLKRRDLGYQRRRNINVKTRYNSEYFFRRLAKKEIILLPPNHSCNIDSSSNINKNELVLNEYIVKGDYIYEIQQLWNNYSTTIKDILVNKFSSHNMYAPIYLTYRLDIGAFINDNKYIEGYNSELNINLNEKLEKYKGSYKWKFVVIIEDPILIAINAISDILKLRNEELYEVTDINNIFLEILNGNILNYWENEFTNKKIIDIYSYTFPKNKKWGVIKNDDFEILVIKTINKKSLSNAFEFFTGISGISFPEEEDFREEIKNDLSLQNQISKINVNKKFLTEVYSQPFVTHFYKQNEIKKMRRKSEKIFSL